MIFIQSLDKKQYGGYHNDKSPYVFCGFGTCIITWGMFYFNKTFNILNIRAFLKTVWHAYLPLPQPPVQRAFRQARQSH